MVIYITMVALLVRHKSLQGSTRVSGVPEPSAIRRFPVETILRAEVEEDLRMEVSYNKWLCNSSITHRIATISSRGITRITRS